MGVVDRDYMREPDGLADAYFATMVRNGWLSLRRLLGVPTEPFTAKPSRDDVARELDNWSSGRDTNPLY